MAIGFIILWVCLGVCGLAICILVIRCCINADANKPQHGAAQQQQVQVVHPGGHVEVGSIEMQQNPMGTGHGRQQQPTTANQSLEWRPLQDEYGRTYYYNPKTGATAWVWQPAVMGRKRNMGASDSSISQI